MPEQARQLKVAEDIASLNVEVKHIKEQQDQNHAELKSGQAKNHKEIMMSFNSLKSKVNEEMETMQTTISGMQNLIKFQWKKIIRFTIVALLVGSFLWVKESRDWILSNIFRIL
jgi:hypothetical protein